jgi:hypothetical protein
MLIACGDVLTPLLFPIAAVLHAAPLPSPGLAGIEEIDATIESLALANVLIRHIDQQTGLKARRRATGHQRPSDEAKAGWLVPPKGRWQACAPRAGANGAGDGKERSGLALGQVA